MKKLCLMYFLLIGLDSISQRVIEPTNQFSVQGLVKTQLSVTIPELAPYRIYTMDSVVIINHLLQEKNTLKHLKGVLLKDILVKAEIKSGTSKELSEYYIICIASDNYKVVFSWNELFNSKTGESVFVLTEVDNKPVSMSNDRIILISTKDIATGRRFVKGLEKIIVERVK